VEYGIKRPSSRLLGLTWKPYGYYRKLGQETQEGNVWSEKTVHN
jgi:hypothetical protein